MPPEQGSSEDWLRFAYSDLDTAQEPASPRVMLETLCFHAQQAAEKAIKAVLLKFGKEIPKTHNLRVLLELLPPTVLIPSEVTQATELSDYAVTIRYPGEFESITEEEHRRAITFAQQVIVWAEGIIHR